MRTPDSDDVGSSGNGGSLADGYGTVEPGDDAGFGEGAAEETRAFEGGEGDSGLRSTDGAAGSAEDDVGGGGDAGSDDRFDVDDDGDVDFDDFREAVADLFGFDDDGDGGGDAGGTGDGAVGGLDGGDGFDDGAGAPQGGEADAGGVFGG